MFERYDEHARRVIFFSRFEAGSHNSPQIEPEHLLLGILRADEKAAEKLLAPVAAQQIKAIPLPLRVGQIVDALYRKRPWVPNWLWRLVATDKLITTSMDLPLSNQSKRVLAYAAEEAELQKQKYIRPAHLLCGLLRDSDSWASKTLLSKGAELVECRKRAEELLGERKSWGLTHSG